MNKEELKNKMDTFIECYKNGMIFGSPTDIEFYENIATLQQKVEQLENIRKEAIEELNGYDPNESKLCDIIDNTLNILNKGSESDE